MHKSYQWNLFLRQWTSYWLFCFKSSFYTTGHYLATECGFQLTYVGDVSFNIDK
jgi:hypothetical protein